ncbi:hypothetical protein ACGTJS_08605 [Faucicola mancuniensis]|uniref:hypothetical protein n=1 Tax=Faucicola mancuniensis TaxID=1309795 RepID=UPI0039778793
MSNTFIQKRRQKFILCQDKNQSVVEFTLPLDNSQIFASQYQTVLPSKEQLLKVIEN